MNFPRIKVCGLARPQDAIAAVTAGADALGVVHYAPSPRSVDAATAATIFAAVNNSMTALNSITPPTKVAVLVNLEPQQALDWATRATATAVQLCGNEQADAWRDFPLPILRRIGVDQTALEQMSAWANVADGFVLDHPASAGGSGKTVDFALAAAICAQAPCLLAGGLGADNVADAIGAVQPSGVDASSRLESEPGHKDHNLVKRFVADAALALNALSSR